MSVNHWLVLRLFSLRDCSELFSIFSVPVLHHFPMTLDVLQKSQKTIWIPVQQRVQAGWFSCPLLSRDVSSSPKSHAITWESPVGKPLRLSQGAPWSNKAEPCSVLRLLQFNAMSWHRERCLPPRTDDTSSISSAALRNT